MNLFDMIAQAQGGSGMEALARQFNLSQQQTQQAVQALLPAFSQGFKQNTADPYGVGSLLTALGSGQHTKYFEDASKAFSPQGLSEGNGILGHLFGSKELSKAVATQASQATGIGQDILKQMLPAIATMLMGGMAKQANNQMAAGSFAASNPLGEIIEQMMKQGQGGGASVPQGGSNNPLGDILGQILGGGAPQGKSSPQAPGGGASDNPLGDILGQILRGGAPETEPQGRQPRQAPAPGGGAGDNPLGDILGQILRGGAPEAEPQGRQPRQAPVPGGGASDNPLGDILGQILRGGAPQEAPKDEEVQEEPRTPPQRRAPRQQPQQQQPSNPLEDIFGKMFNPGGQQTSQTEQYQQGIDNIFEQFRKGVERYQR